MKANIFTLNPLVLTIKCFKAKKSVCIKFSADNILNFFCFVFFFVLKTSFGISYKLSLQDLTFHASCLQWRQFHEMSKPVLWGKI